MKIAILCCCGLSRAQYIHKYLFLLDHFDIEYDVVFWNRELENKQVECNGRQIAFNEYIDSYRPLFFKLIKYLRFSKFVKRIIKRNKYDKLIILTSPMSISVLNLCFFEYRYRYLFDYRDLTKEQYFFYKKIIQKVAEKSELFVTSSPGYIEYFHKKKIKNYSICHNTLPNIHFKKKLILNQKKPLHIVYWGAIRQLDYNKKICDVFGNDVRFELTYHGEGAYKELDDYCKFHNYKNIHFTGKYYLNEIKTFADNTDILFNAYEKDFVTTPSLAVKIYDAIEYHLPMIVTKKTFMDKFLCKYTFVFSLEIKDNVKDEICKWYFSLNQRIVEQEFENLLKIILKDEYEFCRKLSCFLGVENDYKI